MLSGYVANECPPLAAAQESPLLAACRAKESPLLAACRAQESLLLAACRSAPPECEAQALPMKKQRSAAQPAPA